MEVVWLGHPLSELPAASRESGTGKRSGSGCCTLARASEDATTRRKLIVIKLVGGSASRAPAEDSANGDDVVFILNILMNRIVCKTRERKAPPEKRTSTSSADESFLMRSKISPAWSRSALAEFGVL